MAEWEQIRTLFTAIPLLLILKTFERVSWKGIHNSDQQVLCPDYTTSSVETRRMSVMILAVLSSYNEDKL